MQFEEKTIERKEIYQGPIFQVVTDQVELLRFYRSQMRARLFWSSSTARRSRELL